MLYPSCRRAGSRRVAVAEAYDDGVISEVIRPAAVVPEECARAILVELALQDVLNGGVWQSEPSTWRRYDRPWDGPDDPGDAELIGMVQVAYGTPTKYEITVYRVTVTRFGTENDWSVEDLADDALRFGGLTLDDCPRATMAPPPKPFIY